ncbi:hypothetical protein [Aeromicrobium alkaliterrae]|uniref:Uncharacterized protein n=1 Tax=Aeromicrobium alkaliterrae TaxID=302168 RepID=A0ABN2K8Y0_9ACTN
MLTKEQGDARRAIGRLVSYGFFNLSPAGLTVDRDPRRRPEELSIDVLLERLQLCGVPDDQMAVEVRVPAGQAKPHAFLRLVVHRPGVEHLATFISSLREGLALLDNMSAPQDAFPSSPGT